MLERSATRRIGKCAAAAATIVVCFFFLPGIAHSETLVDCDRLLKEAIRERLLTEVTISATGETVRIRTTRGACEESIAVWAARDSSWATTPTRPEPKARKKAADSRTSKKLPESRPERDENPASKAPASDKPVVKRSELPSPQDRGKAENPPERSEGFRTDIPSIVGARRRPQAPPPEPMRNRGCVSLTEHWHSEILSVGGNWYALARAFSIDQDGDGVTDNVGFVLVSEDASELIIRYKAERGQFSGRSLAGLRLDDESVFPSLCFEMATFDLPRTDTVQPIFEVPDLAAEARVRAEEQQANAEEKRPPTPSVPKTGGAAVSPLELGIVAGVAGGAALIGLVILIVVRRRSKNRPAADEDPFGVDEDESEE